MCVYAAEVTVNYCKLIQRAHEKFCMNNFSSYNAVMCIYFKHCNMHASTMNSIHLTQMKSYSIK